MKATIAAQEVQSAAEFDEIATAMDESARRRPSMERVQLLWLYRLIFTPHPLREVMTLAWHSHYATSQDKVNAPNRMLKQNQSQRELWRAPIRQLHRRMLSDGAMRRWLDGLNSTRAQPNENLSREFLELFALGIGHYTERDVREAARALTGWRPPTIRTATIRSTPVILTPNPRRSWARWDSGVSTTWSGSPPSRPLPRHTSPAGSTGRSSPTLTSPRPNCWRLRPTPCGPRETSTSPGGLNSSCVPGCSTRRTAAGVV